MYNLQSLEQRMDRFDYQVISDDKDKRIADLEQQLALTEKALELACEDVYNSDYECIQADYENWQELINVYKEQAKEMMKSE